MIRKISMGIADSLLVATSLYLAFILRYGDVDLSTEHMILFRRILPLIVTARIACNYLFDLYSWPFRHASLHEAYEVLRASVVGTTVFIVLLWGARFTSVSGSVVAGEFLLSSMFMASYRFLPRLFFARRRAADVSDGRKRTLVVGAGDAGTRLARELVSGKGLPYRAVGFLDDDPTKVGTRVVGIPVVGTTAQAAEIAKRLKAEHIIIAIPSLKGEQMRKMLRRFEHVRLPMSTLPPLQEILKDESKRTEVRDIRVEDLLQRQEIQLDEAPVAAYIRGRRILVTGAAGSIGSELCRQIAGFEPEMLLMLDHDENSLYFMEREMAGNDGTKIVPIMASIRDAARMEHVIGKYRPHVVFHAAAHKHVPLMESHPEEAVKNNVVGTLNVISACNRHGVERFVLISTDKAIRPSSVMGCSKRIAEMLVQHIGGGDKSSIRMCAVRFGNVLGSKGSVVPLFLKQIEEGGPVTITHPEVKRYFMTIREAVQLVLHAGAICESGRIYLLNMGEQVKIDLLARDLITMHGLEPDRDVKIVYTGLRPGEKISEELVGEGEKVSQTPVEHIVEVFPGGAPLDLLEKVSMMERCAENGDTEGILALMQEVVPDFRAGRKQ